MIKFGFFFNINYPQKEHFFEKLNLLKIKYNFELITIQESPICPDFVNQISEEEAKNVELDAILVFGGDGTVLAAKKFAIITQAPILGINLGRLGFLTDVKVENLTNDIETLIKKQFFTQKRMLLDVKLYRDGKLISHELSLNDAVIYKGINPKLINVEVYSNNKFVLNTRCDGVVAATPTGSTAYSLSAGGPLLSPILNALIFTPLNPHILSVRPIVFSKTEVIEFILRESNDEVILQIDGKNIIGLQKGDRISVAAASEVISFAKFNKRDFFSILREKLHMGKND